MKKILSIIICFIAVLSAYADSAVLKLEDTRAQKGNTTTVNILLTNDVIIGTITVDVVMPTGVSITSVSSNGSITKNPTFGTTADGRDIYRLVLNKGDYWTTNAEGQVIATLELNVSTESLLGSNIMYIDYYQLVVPITLVAYEVRNVESTLYIQRSEVVNDLPANYALEVIPFATTKGQSKVPLDFLMKSLNENEIYGISFNIELPEGFSFSKDEEDEVIIAYGDRRNSTSSKFVPVMSLDGDGLNADIEYTYSGTSATTGAQCYFTGKSGSVLKLYLNTNANLADGIYTIKLTDISLTDGEGTSHEGDYYFSVFVGTPTETDPIVYGHYTEDGLKTLKDAATNFTGVDMTETEIDTDESTVATNYLAGHLVWGPEYTSYYRHIEGTGKYGTICMPFALTSDGTGTNYYTLTSANSEKNTLTFTQTSSIAANKPALYMSSANNDISLSVSGYKYSTHPGTQTIDDNAGLTFKGTYSSLTINNGEGYYLSNNQFYSKAQNGTFHIAPFHAYLAGSIESSNNAKGLTILIDDETGIHDVTDQISEETMNAIYDLQGIKLNTVRKGAVNIIDGKKVLVK